MKTKLVVLALSASALVLSAAGSASAGVNSNNKIDSITAAGSDTTFFMDQKLSDAYVGSPGCYADTGNTNVGLWGTCLTTPPSGSPAAITTENYDHDTVTQLDPQRWGSGKGLRALCSQELTDPLNTPKLIADARSVEIARSSRPPAATDCTGLVAKGYAKDGIDIVEFKASTTVPVSSANNNSLDLGKYDALGAVTTNTAANGLAIAQGIFRDCTIKTWGQINGNPADTTPLIVWGIQTSSGTYQAFANAIGAVLPAYPGGANRCVTPVTGVNAISGQAAIALPVGALTADRGNSVQENDMRQIPDSEKGVSISFMSNGPFASRPLLKAGASAARVGLVAPSVTTIGNSSYPFARFLYQVTRPLTPVAGHDAAKLAATDFVSWVCGNSTGHTAELNTSISNAIFTEGFVVNADSAGGSDKCTTVNT